MVMQRDRTPGTRRPRGLLARRLLSALAALGLGLGLAVAAAPAANAVAMDVSIQATNATTQPSGSAFTYQINLACSGTNAPACNDSVVTIPLDSLADMTGWGFDVTGGPAGFIQGWTVDAANDQLVITLADTVPAGSSQSIVLTVTPPNLTTPHGTTWSLLPSVSSTDPDMTGTTAPAPATGTATATVPLSVAKTSDATFYRAGDAITYTLRATCPSSKPVGSVYAASMTITDTLPDGLDPVLPLAAGGTWDAGTRTMTWTYPTPDSVPVACGGTAPSAADETIAVVATVGTVGSDAADDFGPYEEVPNTVEVSAEPVGGGDPATDEDTRTVVMLAGTDPAIPGTHSLGKSSAAPLNIAASGTPDRRGTYPGRWLPNGDNSARPASVLDAAPATYTISPRIQYESFQYEIRDKVPCLDDLSGVVYTQSAGTCANPAFHVLGIRIEYSGAAPGAAYAPRYLRTDGSGPFAMTFETSGSGWSGWVVPTADLGDVAEIVIPRDASQENRLADDIRAYGYADPSTSDGQVLQNRAAISWYLGDATTVIPDGGQQTSGPADVFILDGPQVGLTKTMTDVGGVTGTQARIQLAATLFSPGAPTADLVIADLLPADTTLATDPATLTAQLTRPGAGTISFTAAELDIEVIADHLPGRDLIRISLPASELPAEAGQYTLTLSQLTVDKPAAPGVYTNTARVFYDDSDLLPSCSAGEYESSDPDGLRPDPGAEAANCAASATFRTATSSSGQFLLTKTVQGDYDTSPQAFPNIGHVKLTDGVADYAIDWENTGAPTLTGVVLYDVFPHVGDHGVSGAQATEPRLSEFRPLLASVGTPPVGITVSYSASTDPCRPEVYPGQGACVNDWTTDPATLGGLGNVMAIRLVSAADYATGEGFSLGFQMSVPAIDKDRIAWNSVAAFAETTTGVALLPAESPKVGITASDDRFAIGKAVDLAAAVPGDLLTYTVTITNAGTRDSIPTTVRDVLPAGLSFVSADHGGGYDAVTRTIGWSIPAMPRDDVLVLTVTATVDRYQADDEIVNRATLVNPAGYSPPIVDDPCVDDPAASCALTSVPPSPRSDLAFTGGAIQVLGALVTGLGLLAGGAVLLAWRVTRRRS